MHMALPGAPLPPMAAYMAGLLIGSQPSTPRSPHPDPLPTGAREAREAAPVLLRPTKLPPERPSMGESRSILTAL
jgi:hypothetical protein